MLPFIYTIYAGVKIGMADCLSRSPKFEALSTSKYDEQFVVKTTESYDEACMVINTPEENPLDYEKVQLVQTHQERYS